MASLYLIIFTRYRRTLVFNDLYIEKEKLFTVYKEAPHTFRRTEMEIAEIMLSGAAALIFGDLVQLASSRKDSTKQRDIPMAPLACLLVIGSYLILAQAFITNNFRYEEVYYYSSSGLPVLGRLYASWASNTGSWLFLTFTLAIGYLFIRFKIRKRELGLKAFEVMDIIFLFFIIIILLQSPFRLLPEAQMDGRGLNPLLKTPWMLIHPPIVFIGYALTFFSFAFTFNSFGSERPHSSALVRALAQTSWLFLTLGIAIGGLWSYEVLGWGGYWAWDPVETASLIPWLTLTAFFHLTPANSGRNASSRELMIMVTSALIILATTITRGGLTVSVHAFGSSQIGFFLILMMGATALYFLYSQRKSGATLFEFNIETNSVYSSATSLSFLSLIFISLVCLWGLLVPIFSGAFSADPISVEASFFNKWAYPFVLIFVISLIGCNIPVRLTLTKYAGLITALLVLGIGAAYLGFPSSNPLANFGIPLTLFALGSVVYGSFEKIRNRRLSKILLGRSLIHLGVTFIVLGILLSSTLESDYGEIVATPGSTLQLGEIEIDFGEFDFIEPFGNVHTASAEACCNPEAAGLSIPVTAKWAGTSLKGDLKIMLYTIYGVVSKPLILRGLEQDLYLTIHQTEGVYYSLVHSMMGITMPPLDFVVSVKSFPLLNLIWLGVVFMSLGITLPLLGAHKSKKGFLDRRSR